MILDPGLVGASAGPSLQEIDARWTMAYAACLGEAGTAYLDTRRPGGLAVHPLFPVCYEWPLAVDLRERTLPPEVARRGVHATHDLVVHRPPRAGERLVTTATVVAVEPRRPGAYVVTRFATVDEGGAPVTTTHQGTLYLGVTAAGAGGGWQPAPLPAAPPSTEPGAWAAAVEVAATLAHVYSECARIWNPIHTDRVVAAAAGLPDIILHGTATLALAVSAVLGHEPPGAAGRVRRIACRFGAMVRMPSTLSVRGRSIGGSAGTRAVTFDVLTADGRPALRDGWLVLAIPSDGGAAHA